MWSNGVCQCTDIGYDFDVALVFVEAGRDGAVGTEQQGQSSGDRAAGTEQRGQRGGDREVETDRKREMTTAGVQPLN